MNKKDFLSKLNLRTTPMREQIVTLFLDNEGIAFSEVEINEIFNHSLDRVSIYRTIRTLVKKSVVHKIVCENGVLKYAHKATPKENVMHPHFECTRCGKVLCLNEKGITGIELPEGYLQEVMHTLVQGICPDCATGTPKQINN